MKAQNLPQNLYDVALAFEKKTEEIVNGFLRTVDAQAASPLIYHYTDDAGLRGILESGELRLTDIFYLNDPSELKHGFSLAVKELSDRAKAGPVESRVFADAFSDLLELGLQTTAHYFVCSFSSDGDDLGQWRAYAENGRGYALGFDGKLLEDVFTRANGVAIPTNSTFPVTYDDSKLADIHRRLVDGVFDLISLPFQRGIRDRQILNDYFKQLSVTLSVAALRSSIFFKHPGYRTENEFRFLQMHKGNASIPDVKLRYRSHEIVRYCTFKWNLRPGLLKRIIAGPATDSTKAARFMDDCLQAYRFKDVETGRSPIPYRPVGL